jgi:hypothetical protein
MQLVRGEDPLRKVSSAGRWNFVANFLNDLQGVGCRVEIPPEKEGLGARIIVDGSSDIPMPEGVSPGAAPFNFEIYPDGDGLRLRGGSLFLYAFAETATPGEYEAAAEQYKYLASGTAEHDAQILAAGSYPETATRVVTVAISGEALAATIGADYPAGDPGVDWWPIGKIEFDADGAITDIWQFVGGDIGALGSGEIEPPSVVVDDLSIDLDTGGKVQWKDWESPSEYDGAPPSGAMVGVRLAGPPVPTLEYYTVEGLLEGVPLDEDSIRRNVNGEVELAGWEDLVTEADIPDTEPHENAAIPIKQWNETGAGSYDATLEYVTVESLLAGVPDVPLDETSIDWNAAGDVELNGWAELVDETDIPATEFHANAAIPIKQWNETGEGSYNAQLEYLTAGSIAGLALGAAAVADPDAYAAATITDPPTQTEVQDIADALQSTRDQLAALLESLRDKGIILTAE